MEAVHAAESVERRFAAIADDPWERLAWRERFYAASAPAFGAGEIEFTKWMIARGVLDSVERGGSAWWRRVQARLAVDAERAACGDRSGDPAVARWAAFLADPSPRTWYCAHHASVALGYIEGVDEVAGEPRSERRLAYTVLARILFAQALAEGEAFGALGPFVSDPRSRAIRAMLERPALYPSVYPAPSSEDGGALGRLEQALVARVDRHVVGARFDALVERAAVRLDLPRFPAAARRYAELARSRDAT